MHSKTITAEEAGIYRDGATIHIPKHRAVILMWNKVDTYDEIFLTRWKLSESRTIFSKSQ